MSPRLKDCDDVYRARRVSVHSSFLPLAGYVAPQRQSARLLEGWINVHC